MLSRRLSSKTAQFNRRATGTTWLASPGRSGFSPPTESCGSRSSTDAPTSRPGGGKRRGAAGRQTRRPRPVLRDDRAERPGGTPRDDRERVSRLFGRGHIGKMDRGKLLSRSVRRVLRRDLQMPDMPAPGRRQTKVSVSRGDQQIRKTSDEIIRKMTAGYMLASNTHTHTDTQRTRTHTRTRRWAPSEQ